MVRQAHHYHPEPVEGPPPPSPSPINGEGSVLHFHHLWVTRPSCKITQIFLFYSVFNRCNLNFNHCNQRFLDFFRNLK
jgi:hypothetical protein